jgi:hypothetical protein
MDDPNKQNPEIGLLEFIAKRIGAIVEWLVARANFRFGLCSLGFGTVLLFLSPTLGLVTVALGVGACFGKVGLVIDNKLLRNRRP